MYQNWDEEQFKEKFRIFKCNIDYILSVIRPFIEKTPTNLVPDPIQPEKQLALTIYRLAHGCSFAVVSDLFVVSKVLAIEKRNHVIRELPVHFYNCYVKMTENEVFLFFFFFFLSGFSLTNIHESQDYHFHPLHKHLNISRAITAVS